MPLHRTLKRGMLRQIRNRSIIAPKHPFTPILRLLIHSFDAKAVLKANEV